MSTKKHAQYMREKRWGDYGEEWPENYRQCLKCKEIKSFDHFHKHSKCKFGVNSVCKNCRHIKSSNLHHKTPICQRLYNSAKSRATKKRLDFNLVPSDIIIPDKCPVFKTKFVIGTQYAASLDRINPDKGYIKGNIQVLSVRANLLKNNATIEELEQIIKFMRENNYG